MMINYITYFPHTLMNMSIEYVLKFLINTCKCFFLNYHYSMCGKIILILIFKNVKLKKFQIQIFEIFIKIECFSTCQQQ
jgi:hypothetical protein